MFNLERTRATSQHLDASGGEYTLVSERIASRCRESWGGAVRPTPIPWRSCVTVDRGRYSMS